MSKMDDLRKMREARYEAAAARAKMDGGTPAKKAATRPPVASTKAPAKAAAKAAATAPEEIPAGEPALCGHRNMSGRTCTREQGHAAKSHRYS